MQSLWDKALTAILVLAAVAIAVVLVQRQFLAQPLAREARIAAYDADWRAALPAGRSVGNPAAPVRVVVFSDLQCPFCRRFHTSLTAALNKYPDSVSYSFVHFPLGGHEYAFGAAQVAECASLSGRFSSALDFIFANQDSLGARELSWFAEGAGIADSAGWAQCMADTTNHRLIHRGLAQGARMAVIGTPVVFLNGWRYPGTPNGVDFARAVDALLAGQTPYPDFPAFAIRAEPTGGLK